MVGHVSTGAESNNADGNAVDPLSSSERSERMSRVRSHGNRSTELAVAHALRRHHIVGWRRHEGLPGTPDFYFASARLALFVHGCFWHGCAKCDRRIPRTRRDFWLRKIHSNLRRDRRVRRLLRSSGIFTITVWEHELNGDQWLRRLARRLKQL